MKYIGNKTNLLGFIEHSLCHAGVPMGGVFADLFSGTTSVAQHFKRKNFSVIANDFMNYSYALQFAFVKNNEIPTFDKLRAEIDLRQQLTPADSVFEYLNAIGPEEGYVFQNFGAGGTFGRMYFTAENAGRIDGIRDKIASWEVAGWIDQSEYQFLLAALIDAADHVANMSGTYGAYLKIWRPTALKPIVLRIKDVYNNSCINQANLRRAEDLIEEISGDVLYLDPPYNQRQYASNFHVLESIAVWDKQTLKGVTGLRDYSDQKSDFCSKALALSALQKIITRAEFRFIALSYNNEGLISHSQIEELLGEFGNVSCFETEYRRFRTERDHESRKYKDVDDRTQEFLFVLDTLS